MPDPLDTPSDAIDALELSRDGMALGDMIDIMTSARQWGRAAKVAGFSDDQSFQFAMNYFTTMMRISAERAERAERSDQ